MKKECLNIEPKSLIVRVIDVLTPIYRLICEKYIKNLIYAWLIE